jgi:hypothetical protein
MEGHSRCPRTRMRTGLGCGCGGGGGDGGGLLDQEREIPRRKPSLLCLRLKLAEQGCFRPRDLLPKQSTASAGLRMAARPLGQRVTGGPRCPWMHRATTTAPLSPPSASNRAPAPVVDLECALGRGEGVNNKAQIRRPIQQRTYPPLPPEDGRFDPTSCTSFDSS